MVTHSLVGILAGKMLPVRLRSWKMYAFSAVLPLIADWDVIGMWLGVPYGHFFGHRGFFHSILFALLLAFVCVCIGWPKVN